MRALGFRFYSWRDHNFSEEFSQQLRLSDRSSPSLRGANGPVWRPPRRTPYKIATDCWRFRRLTKTDNSLLIVHMTTLTITDAKKNLGKWLSAAVKGEDIGILAGATVVALRPVEVEATDYAWREYGVTPSQLDAFITTDNARIEKLRREGKLLTLPNNLEEALEKIAGHRSRRTKAPSRAAKRAARRGRAKAA